MSKEDEAPIIMSAEELWAMDEVENQKYRGEDREITAFDRKAAEDMKQFAAVIAGNNDVRIHGPGQSRDADDYSSDEEYSDIDFDVIKATMN